MTLEEQIKKELLIVNPQKHYNGWADKRKEEYGYHSFDLSGVQIKGQRNPKIRLNEMKKHVNFDNKVIIDLGCNTGGMLIHLENIRGYGFDIDECAINAATNISKLLDKTNITFQTYDFDHQPINKIKSIIKETPDIVFALSIGKWIKKHRELYQFLIELGASTFILETNNKSTGKSELDFFDSLGWKRVLIMDKSVEDTTGNRKRKTFLITKP